MDNPGPKLKKYLRTHHPSLASGDFQSTPREKAVHVDAVTTQSKTEYQFRIGFPRSAPENARPLVLEVRHKRQLVWSFRHNVQPYVGITNNTRVHLFEMSVEDKVVFLLVVVNEGNPDLVVSVLRVDGTLLSDKLEAAFKTHIARLWGMRYKLTDEERRELEALMPTRPKKS